MEVHHHPHLDSDSHRKKGAKEYFLEFLMIFLAVTLGFFAENVREHFDEEKTTKQYLEDFRQELLQNKDLYQHYDSFFAQKIPATDSLIKFFIDKKENVDLKTSARLIINTRMVFVSTISKAAYDQMVNSGGLKYIHNAAFRDSLTIYEASIHDFEKYNEIVDDYRSDAFPDISSIEPLYSMSSHFMQDKNVALAPFATLSQKERTEILNFYGIYLIRYISDRIIAHRLNKTNEVLINMLDTMLDK